MCVRNLPHTTIYVSWYCYLRHHTSICADQLGALPTMCQYYYICVLILPHTTIYVSWYCYMCHHTSICADLLGALSGAAAAYADVCWRMLTHAGGPALSGAAAAYADACRRPGATNYMCHHTSICADLLGALPTTCVNTTTCVLILPHTTSYYYMCVLILYVSILLYMCPHSTSYH
jgi:hypothetical protein